MNGSSKHDAATPVEIGLLLPDILGTYSDSGNATVLAQRLRWRGIPAVIHTITVRDQPKTDCAIYLLGGGEDRAQQFAARWLGQHPTLLRTMAERAQTLAVCAGLQVLGRHKRDAEGDTHAGVGLLDLTTSPRQTRAIGEVVSGCLLPGVGRLTGFENHRGATTLGAQLAPLAEVLSGIGNGAGTPVDGVMTSHIIGTYLHGPVLARNPALADLILERVLCRPLTPLDLPDITALRRHYLDAQPGKRSRRASARRRPPGATSVTATRPETEHPTNPETRWSEELTW